MERKKITYIYDLLLKAVIFFFALSGNPQTGPLTRKCQKGTDGSCQTDHECKNYKWSKVLQLMLQKYNRDNIIFKTVLPITAYKTSSTEN